MADTLRLSHPALRVLALFLDAAPGELAGADIVKAVPLSSGTLYPLLMRLERAGWLSSRWEEGDASDEKRPLRRYYRLTALGCERARTALAELAVPAYSWAAPAGARS